MNNNLTYRLVFYPNKWTPYSACESVNFLCSDGKIHVRLRDYDKEEVISGFVNKLTYLVTYFVNNVVGVDKAKFSDETELINFATNKLNTIMRDELVRELDGDKFKGIKIYPNYRKIKHYSKLGSIDKGVCPSVYTTHEGTIGALSDFFHTIGLNVHSFLFSDAYEIHITKDSSKVTYSKFLNKNNKVKKVMDNSVDLWNI